MAESGTSLPLIPQDQVMTLKGAQQGRKKVGQGIVYMKEFFILYIQVLLSKLGIHQWSPNLKEASDTLYNEAFLISTIQSFCQLAIGGAYEHMNINHCYLNKIKLLHETYNHYVHYYMTQRFNKEMKEAGKHQKNQEKAAVQLSKKSLWDICYKLGVANSFPKQYLKILAHTNAHSDDEYISKSNYKINKLLFRSENANKFMRRVDEEIEKADRIEKKILQERNQIVVDSPSISIHSHPPKGLPIDFYNSSWFNNCPPGQKPTVEDSFNVAFLPDASQSIRDIQHPDERPNDQNFTEKYWEKCAESYDLSHEIAREDKDLESDDSEIINHNSESDDDTGEESLEPDKNEGQLFDQLSDQDTEMAHAQDLNQFMVGAPASLLDLSGNKIVNIIGALEYFLLLFLGV
ncbi:hypothetical protein O181_113107 [Austropuccinia psidii MF-1]|uniref:Uncharacterized protein n=1 Tax=Austropuccinia psidii MF-1 TaxID=1389203 RepID=A0A9Q3K4Z6_9BASI|nr:hypothetical protein [Austropuccinia psidii MF-1]